MKAWHIKNQENITLEEFTSKRQDDEIKVKISKATVSPGDLCLLAQDNAHIEVPSHSAIGYVSESSNSDYKFGTKVVISPFIENMHRGKKQIDVMGIDVDGLLQDFINLKEDNVYVLPEGIKDEEAVFTDYIATGIKALDQFKSKKGNYIVIAGANTLGLIIGQIAVYYQLVPILLDIDKDKLDIAKKWGMYYTLNLTYDNAIAEVEKITGGRMCDAAIITGEGVALATVPYLIKDEGQVLIAGYLVRENSKIDAAAVLKKQLTIKGVRHGDGEMSTAINLLANKIIQTDGFINCTVDFNDFPKVVDECVKYPYKYNKILVEFD